MGQENQLGLAKKALAERMGVMVQNLEFAFIWEYGGDVFFSFLINEPEHSHYKSTLSVNVSKMT